MQLSIQIQTLPHLKLKHYNQQFNQILNTVSLAPCLPRRSSWRRQEPFFYLPINLIYPVKYLQISVAHLTGINSFFSFLYPFAFVLYPHLTPQAKQSNFSFRVYLCSSVSKLLLIFSVYRRAMHTSR
jgi:hypothetical protein